MLIVGQLSTPSQVIAMLASSKLMYSVVHALSAYEVYTAVPVALQLNITDPTSPAPPSSEISTQVSMAIMPLALLHTADWE
mmetsp:Transcript_47177/g.78288  ORF Transcript_47177/g.78288 Transcript_47177/m.78288 type:complete len:81 (-) Transcript_47177:153-395(-)